MRPAPILLLASFSSLSAFAQGPATCANPFQAGLVPGSEVLMTLRSGDIDIIGTDKPGLRVTCSGDDAAGARVRFAANHLTISGGGRRNVSFRIEVPRSLHLRIRCTAGDLTITGITGNKDVDLHAGNLTIAVGDPHSYRDVKASVLAGNVVASVFGVEKDGLFRSFRRENPNGSYRLRASIMAGDLVLR